MSICPFLVNIECKKQFYAGQEVYRIIKGKKKFLVNCNHNHYSEVKCNACNNKFVHYKTFDWWYIAKHTFKIASVRKYQDGRVQYYEDECCYYKAEDNYLFGTFGEALRECDKRNEIVYQTQIKNML